MRLKTDLPSALKYQAVIIESAARDAGLDFFDVVFELLEARDVNGVAAYGGFPVRYPSWRFGMEYERLEKGRNWGLSKIYELVSGTLSSTSWATTSASTTTRCPSEHGGTAGRPRLRLPVIRTPRRGVMMRAAGFGPPPLDRPLRGRARDAWADNGHF
jgi:hypothetical protein